MLNFDLKREFYKLSIGVIIMSVIMVAIFAALGKFDYKVVTGAALGTLVTIANYLFLAFSIERISQKDDVNNGKSIMTFSYFIRLAVIAVTIIIAIKLPIFNYIAVALPFLFPRVVIVAINLIDSKKDSKK
jgi:uncharacterized MnhB-related membrane protein